MSMTISENIKKYTSIHYAFLRNHVKEKNYNWFLDNKIENKIENKIILPENILIINSIPLIKDFIFLEKVKNKEHEYLYISKNKFYIKIYNTEKRICYTNSGNITLKFFILGDIKLPITFFDYSFKKDCLRFFNKYELSYEKINEKNKRFNELFKKKHIRKIQIYSDKFYESLYGEKDLPFCITNMENEPEFKDYDVIKCENELRGQYLCISKKEIYCGIVLCNIAKKDYQILKDINFIDFKENVKFNNFCNNFYVTLIFGKVDETMKPIHLVNLKRNDKYILNIYNKKYNNEKI